MGNTQAARRKNDADKQIIGQKKAHTLQNAWAFFRLAHPLRMMRIWYRWPDLNRHDLRHHPLKMACLPISPHRLKVILFVR